METAAPVSGRPIRFEAESRSAARACLDAVGGLDHLGLDRVAQLLRLRSVDAGSDEGEQKRVFDQGNAALVIPEPREIL